jgi:hypothetical protein
VIKSWDEQADTCETPCWSVSKHRWNVSASGSGDVMDHGPFVMNSANFCKVSCIQRPFSVAIHHSH